MTPDRLNLKRATQEMIRGVGGVEAGAAFCRVGKSVLSDTQNPSRPDCFAALDVIADLEPLARDRTGWPHVTQALCTVMGGTFVALPDVPPESGDVLALLADQAREQSDLTTAICGALGDGRIDRAEARAALAQVDDVIRVAAAMRAELKMIAEA